MRLPYFWDEAGYYVPAARDLLGGSLIPHSTPSNAHPPLVLAWLALCWKAFGQSILVTRCAMLLLAAFSLLGYFRLARFVSNSTVAACATFLTAIYPVFFAQSSLALVDLPAAGLIFWGLAAYFHGRTGNSAIWFSLAVMAKETAILAPLALVIFQIFGSLVRARLRKKSVPVSASAAKAAPQSGRGVGTTKSRALPGLLADSLLINSLPGQAGSLKPSRPLRKSGWLLVPIAPLALWYAYHYARTGFVFGNPEFVRYNIQETLHPLRILLALPLRLWQLFGYFGLYLPTVACLLAMRLAPAEDSGRPRPRIDVSIQFCFLAIASVYVIALAVIGGAVLARYMLPVVPLVILVCVSTVWRRLRPWKIAVAIIALGFISGLFLNPPYGFSPEDNLAYRDYILLHQRAESLLQSRYPNARVLTAWPASDEITQPYLGYLSKPMQILRIEDFSPEQVLSAADARARFDVALVFSTKYQPPRTIFDRWRLWQEWKSRYFGYHVDLTPQAAASVLGAKVVYIEHRHGQWVGIIEMQEVEEAGLIAPSCSRALWPDVCSKSFAALLPVH